MTGTVLPPDRLKRCAAALVAENPGAAGPVDRAELEPLLASALIGPVAIREYLGALAAATGGRATPSENPPREIPLPSVLRDGLAVLTDEQLFRLARSPESLTELNRAVGSALERGEAGAFWTDAEQLPDEIIPREYHLAAERAVSEFRRVEKKTRPVSELPHKRWLTVALPVAVAASLMLAFFLGTRWSGDGGRDVHLAAVSVRGDVTRGIEDIALEVGNGTNRRVFLTVVGVVPGRKTPGVFYRHQGKYLELPAGGTTTLRNLPPSDLGGSTVLLLVSTDVPAGEVVLNVVPAPLTPETAQAAAEQIREALRELGISSDVRVVTLPATTK